MLGSAAARVIMLVAVLGASGPAPVRAKNPTPALLQGGVIEGLVYDSTASQPLAGARVFLWNTSMFATTDDAGHFAIEDVPPGDYSLVFFHPRLTTLGVSSGRTPITVDGDDRVSVALSTPSMITIMNLLCELEDPGQQAGRAIGYVGDASTGVPLPGAQVLLTWMEEASDGREHLGTAQARTDADGWYSICTLPAGLDVQGTAYFFGQQTNSRSFQPPDGLPTRVDFTLGAVQLGSVTGLLRDADGHRPIPDAEVTLTGVDMRVVTDSRGQFRLKDVPPGSYQLETTHLAYADRSDLLEVGAGQDLQVELELATEPIELEPMVVTVESGEELQALAVGGRLISRAQIDEVRARSQDIGDMLRQTNTPGMVVSRGGPTVCVGFRRGQVTMQRRECTPAQVYINDVPTSDPTVAMNLNPEVIDRVILVPPVEAGVLYSFFNDTATTEIYTRAR
jgi:hypothetical protein